jgi:hypothetical protein
MRTARLKGVGCLSVVNFTDMCTSQGQEKNEEKKIK